MDTLVSICADTVSATREAAEPVTEYSEATEEAYHMNNILHML